MNRIRIKKGRRKRGGVILGNVHLEGADGGQAGVAEDGEVEIWADGVEDGERVDAMEEEEAAMEEEEVVDGITVEEAEGGIARKTTPRRISRLAKTKNPRPNLKVRRANTMVLQ